jgi:hypothetical protein
VRDFDMLPGLSKDDEPYVPYALAMAGLSVAVFLTLIDGRLIQCRLFHCQGRLAGPGKSPAPNGRPQLWVQTSYSERNRAICRRI